MRISYRPLWVILAQRSMTKKDLRDVYKRQRRHEADGRVRAPLRLPRVPDPAGQDIQIRIMR